MYKKTVNLVIPCCQNQNLARICHKTNAPKFLSHCEENYVQFFAVYFSIADVMFLQIVSLAILCYKNVLQNKSPNS